MTIAPGNRQPTMTFVADLAQPLPAKAYNSFNFLQPVFGANLRNVPLHHGTAGCPTVRQGE
ncbi:MAG TPA: hypothetical protein VFD87_01440 [Phototrophicaceae bacterium]|nr:hypothetical protein [Phototrophicaceae bacterium]